MSLNLSWTKFDNYLEQVELPDVFFCTHFKILLVIKPITKLYIRKLLGFFGALFHPPEFK